MNTDASVRALSAAALALVLAACSSGAQEEVAAQPTGGETSGTTEAGAEAIHRAAQEKAATAEATGDAAGDASGAAGPATLESLSADYHQPGGTISASEPLRVPSYTNYLDPASDGYDPIFTEYASTFTVGDLREGAAEDLTDHVSGSNLRALGQYDMYYLDFDVTIDDGPVAQETEEWIGFYAVPAFEAYDTTGWEGGTTILPLAGFETCPAHDAGELTRTGAASGCQIILTQPGAGIDHLAYVGDGYMGADNETYSRDPVILTMD